MNLRSFNSHRLSNVRQSTALWSSLFSSLEIVMTNWQQCNFCAFFNARTLSMIFAFSKFEASWPTQNGKSLQKSRANLTSFQFELVTSTVKSFYWPRKNIFSAFFSELKWTKSMCKWFGWGAIREKRVNEIKQGKPINRQLRLLLRSTRTMSKANMCSTANYSVDDVKVNIENEIESLKKTINFQTNVCSESPTILITNYAHSNESIDTSTNTLSFNANPKSSIAIYTRKSDSEKASNSATPSINILINNHFDHPASTKTTTTNASLNPIHNSKTIKIERDTSDDAATTEIDDFWLEEMILAKHEDGRSYVGQVIEINRPANYIRIKFDDRSERSLRSEEIRKLNSLADDQLLCIVCKQSDNTAIRSCARCFRASHKKCMEGNRDDKTGVWHCERCMNKIRIFSKKIKLICNENSGNQLSYDVNELTWDAQHQRNVEEIYCYCGKKGKWYMQMLQCVRCQQWFHANCVKCLNFPLYFGDRFYLFACSICNHGTEFIRRLSMTIDDVVQLMLFNLTLHHKRNYFSLSNVIYPYIRDNWNALQLPQKVNFTSIFNRCNRSD